MLNKARYAFVKGKIEIQVVLYFIGHGVISSDGGQICVIGLVVDGWLGGGGLECVGGCPRHKVPAPQSGTVAARHCRSAAAQSTAT